MKIIFILFSIIIFSKIVYSNVIFETNEYELKFTSSDINSDKEKKINEIKIRSFKKILQQMLTDESLDKLNIKNLDFINRFILNFKINDEKIINNNYYSKIKVNFRTFRAPKHQFLMKLLLQSPPKNFLKVV